MRIVVDLPDPLGPRKPVTVPGRTSKDRSSTATTLPNRLDSPRASITRSALHGAVLHGVGGYPTRTLLVAHRPTISAQSADRKVTLTACCIDAIGSAVGLVDTGTRTRGRPHRRHG